MGNVIKVNPFEYSIRNYESTDTGLVTEFELDSQFTDSSYVELYVYDMNENLIRLDLNHLNYTAHPDASDNTIRKITLHPDKDLKNLGFNQGEYIVYYNFLINHIGTQSFPLYIESISSDRKEIKLNSTSLSALDLNNQANAFIRFREQQIYFVDFNLNLGGNDLVIANNLKIENENTDNPSILIKLYEELPTEYNEKDEVWVVTNFNEPTAYKVEFPKIPNKVRDNVRMAGPNFNIPLKSQVNNSSQNLSKADILSNTSNASFNQIQKVISSSGVEINVDYTDASNFVHFSSLSTRLENFNYKLHLLENYSSSLSTLNNVSNSSSTTTILDTKIKNVISNFDGFEYYLYYTSGSKAWPKTTSQPPYELAKTDSVEALTWLGSNDYTNSNYGGYLLSASLYDEKNPNQLLKSIPEYLREDPQNKPYELFIDMVAQYYDTVWLHTKDITQKYNTDNRLDFGISKDLVADAIRDFGVKLYQNNFSNQDLYTAFLGMTPSGSLFPFPNLTTDLPAQPGSEFVDTLISASNDVIPLDDVNKSLYKRIYHNIPYLLNTKGTLTGLRALITSYGIPDTILRISEFGGKDKVNSNDWDYYFHKFNYAWDTQGTNTLNTPWEVNEKFKVDPLTDSPGTVEFRFKTPGIPPKPEPIPDALYAKCTLKGYTTSPGGITNDTVIIENIDTSASDLDVFISLVNNLGFSYNGNLNFGLGIFGVAGEEDDGGRYVNFSPFASIVSITPSPTISGEYHALLTSSLYLNQYVSTDNTAGLVGSELEIISGSWEIIDPNKSPLNGGANFIETPFETPTQPITSQTLWYTTSSLGVDKALILEYTGSYLDSGSYSGSIPDPYYQYGNLKYISQPNTPQELTCSISLPFFNEDWWSVMIRNNGLANDADFIITEPHLFDFIISEDGKYIVKESTSNTSNLGNINLFASNKIYNGNDGTKIGFFESASIEGNGTGEGWENGDISHFAKGYDSYKNFDGNLQEIRYYNVALGNTAFKDYVMNPLSIEGNGLNTSPDQLTFRASLGSEGDILNKGGTEIVTQFDDIFVTQNGNILITQGNSGANSLQGNSLHPKIAGTWEISESFANNSLYNLEEDILLNPNREYYFLDQPAVGLKNRITDKIRFEEDVHEKGDTLSPYRRVTQKTEASASYTDNINYLEVAFSPQNELNDDIINQIGHFNVGDYIGDPKHRFEGTNYKDLHKLSEEYFQKYIKNYNLKDFIRLIKFFDNSLFKMIKDFIPLRTSLSSGLVIKQHLLERNKYKQPVVSQENEIFTGSIQTAFISGSTGGMLNPFNDVKMSPQGEDGNGPDNKFALTQSWADTTPSLIGDHTKIYDNQDEFYDGIYSGSLVEVTNGELNEGCDIKTIQTQFTDMYGIRYYSSDNWEITKFINSHNSPLKGYISIFNQLSFEILPNFLFILDIDRTDMFETNTVKFTLQTQGVPNNTIIPITITGAGVSPSSPPYIEDDDVNGNLPTGFFVFNNSSQLIIPFRNDLITEGEETLTLTLTDYPSHTKSVNIKDLPISHLETVTSVDYPTNQPYTEKEFMFSFEGNSVSGTSTVLVDGNTTLTKEMEESYSWVKMGANPNNILHSNQELTVGPDFPGIYTNYDIHEKDWSDPKTCIIQEFEIKDKENFPIKDPNAQISVSKVICYGDPHHPWDDDYWETNSSQYKGVDIEFIPNTDNSRIRVIANNWLREHWRDSDLEIGAEGNEPINPSINVFDPTRARFRAEFTVEANSETKTFILYFFIFNKYPYFDEVSYEPTQNGAFNGSFDGSFYNKSGFFDSSYNSPPINYNWYNFGYGNSNPSATTVNTPGTPYISDNNISLFTWGPDNRAVVWADQGGPFNTPLLDSFINAGIPTNDLNVLQQPIRFNNIGTQTFRYRESAAMNFTTDGAPSFSRFKNSDQNFQNWASVGRFRWSNFKRPDGGNYSNSNYLVPYIARVDYALGQWNIEGAARFDCRGNIVNNYGGWSGQWRFSDAGSYLYLQHTRGGNGYYDNIDYFVHHESQIGGSKKRGAVCFFIFIGLREYSSNHNGSFGGSDDYGLHYRQNDHNNNKIDTGLGKYPYGRMITYTDSIWANYQPGNNRQWMWVASVMIYR